MKKSLIISLMLLGGCSLYDQYAQRRIEEKARLDSQYKAQTEAARVRGEEMERQRKEQQFNYISAKANIECLRVGFKKGTNDFNQCTYVFSSDAENEIKRRESEERDANLTTNQQYQQQEQLRKQQFFDNYLNIMALNKQNNITCNTFGATTRCY